LYAFVLVISPGADEKHFFGLETPNGLMLDIFERSLVDEHGRSVLLRGCSLATSKLPNGQPSHQLEDFYDHRRVSFLDRPLPLKDFDLHLTRLKTCGFNCLRLVVPWEAIEHGGPGLYDLDYMDYLKVLLDRMAFHGMLAIIDVHRP
jgi:hypothetical protein